MTAKPDATGHRYRDAELLEHLLRVEAFDEEFVPECELCAEIQKRIAVLIDHSHVHRSSE